MIRHRNILVNIIDAFVQEFISGAFSNWTEAEIVAIEDQMIEKLEELAQIETHKQTYPVSRTEFGEFVVFNGGHENFS